MLRVVLALFVASATAFCVDIRTPIGSLDLPAATVRFLESLPGGMTSFPEWRRELGRARHTYLFVYSGGGERADVEALTLRLEAHAAAARHGWTNFEQPAHFVFLTENPRLADGTFFSRVSSRLGVRARLPTEAFTTSVVVLTGSRALSATDYRPPLRADRALLFRSDGGSDHDPFGRRRLTSFLYELSDLPALAALVLVEDSSGNATDLALELFAYHRFARPHDRQSQRRGPPISLCFLEGLDSAALASSYAALISFGEPHSFLGPSPLSSQFGDETYRRRGNTALISDESVRQATEGLQAARPIVGNEWKALVARPEWVGRLRLRGRFFRALVHELHEIEGLLFDGGKPVPLATVSYHARSLEDYVSTPLRWGNFSEFAAYSMNREKAMESLRAQSRAFRVLEQDAEEKAVRLLYDFLLLDAYLYQVYRHEDPAWLRRLALGLENRWRTDTTSCPRGLVQ